MGSSLPSSDLLHMWLVTGTLYTLGCLITWVCTFKLLRGFYTSERNKRSSMSNLEVITNLQSTQMVSAVVCLGFSFGLPLQCIQMFYFDKAEDKAIRKHGDSDRWMDYLNEPITWGFGVPATVLIIISITSDIFLNISKLSIFDETVSQASSQRKTCYFVIWLVNFICSVMWAVWFAFIDEFQGLFLVFSGLIIVLSFLLQLSLAREFVLRLAGFIRIRTQHSNHGIRVRSQTVSEIIQSDGNRAALPLARVIIKDCLLSVAKMGSVVLNGLIFLISVTVLSGIINAYFRAGVMQIAVSLPLCVYLSFDFANPDYDRLCSKIHHWIEHSA